MRMEDVNDNDDSGIRYGARTSPVAAVVQVGFEAHSSGPATAATVRAEHDSGAMMDLNSGSNQFGTSPDTHLGTSLSQLPLKLKSTGNSGTGSGNGGGAMAVPLSDLEHRPKCTPVRAVSNQLSQSARTQSQPSLTSLTSELWR